MLIDLKYWLSNFLPYSIESWRALLGYYNQALLPYALLVIPLTIAILWLSCQQSLWQKRIALWLLACCWLWAGLVFLRLHFATLNWSAGYVLWLLVVQACLLVIYSFSARFQAVIRQPRVSWRYLLVLIAIAALPLIQLQDNYHTHQLGWFALTPDPTVLTTLALLGAMRFLPFTLMVIPVVWGILVFANSWPLDDSAGMALLPLSIFVLVFLKRR